MRLTCPNCDAQYEVPDDVIPTEGRDVQCSSCGQTWFQHHADHPPETDETDLTEDEPAPEEETAPPPEPEPEPEPVPETKSEPEPESDPTPAGTAIPVRKELDPAVADILRQEAETEQELRRKQNSDPLESQPDLGLGDGGAPEPDGAETERRTLEARKRMARMRGEPEPMSEAEVTAAAISSRRDLLPDIDEINSTLRTESDRSSEDDQARIDAPTSQKRKRGFRSGFLLVVVLFGLLLALYAYAPQIARAVPWMDPYLSAYVAWVDGLRLWLDGHVQNAARWLDGVASSSGE